MSKSFAERRLEQRMKHPDYEIECWIRGVVSVETGFVEWSVSVEGEDNCDAAAGILERAAEVLREP